MRTLIAGGGTGGHLTPALAVAEELRDSDPGGAVLLVGRRGGIAHDLVEQAGVPLETIGISGLQLSSPASVASFALRLPQAVRRARRLIAEFGADIVVGAAGYVCVPVVIAARKHGVPVVLMEQNAVPGRAIRLLASRAEIVAVSFEETRRRLDGARTTLTGNPVRKEFRDGAPPPGPHFRRLLVWGGSQGARRINTALRDCVASLLRDHPDLVVVHQCGRLDESAMTAAWESLDPGLRPRWQVAPFYARVAELIAASDLVVMRAGGSSLAEVSAMGRPMILIPYPHAGGHQRHNAAPYVAAGAAHLLDDHECDGPRLRAAIEAIAGDPARWRAMAAQSRSMGRPDAARLVAETVRRVAGRA